MAKLVSDGRTFDDVGKFTLKQAESVLKEQVEKFKNQARLQGCTFKDDKPSGGSHYATTDDIRALAGFLGAEINPLAGQQTAGD